MSLRGMLSTDDAAERVGVTTRTIRRWCNAGLLRPRGSVGGRSYYHELDVLSAHRASTPRHGGKTRTRAGAMLHLRDQLKTGRG